MILIATPARLSTPKGLLARCERVAQSFAYLGTLEWRLYLNEQPPLGPRDGKYYPNAAARNELIERYLKPWHDWVLWLDVDIIEAPGNLVMGLMELALRKAGELPAIAAPMVWVERVGEGPVAIPVGGWFYDTGGYVDADGQYADFERGVAGEGDEVEMESVGCVYLVPAEIYRQGARYEPVGNEVEHLSFMRQARKMGATVWATRNLNVVHAYLPRWGSRWNSG